MSTDQAGPATGGEPTPEAPPSPFAVIAEHMPDAPPDPELAAVPASAAGADLMPPLMADIADPGQMVIAGPGVQAFAFYLGKPGQTPHVWTDAQLERQVLRYALPVWVPNLADLSPSAGAFDGQDAAAALHALGVPRGVAIRVDMETEVGVTYLRQFRSQVNLAGYWFGAYGSASTVFGNPPGGAGYWVADWTGDPHQYDHPGVSATQYASAGQAGTPWDLSELAPHALHHLWDRRPPPPPPAWEHDAAAALEHALTDLGKVQAGARAALAALQAHGG